MSRFSMTNFSAKGEASPRKGGRFSRLFSVTTILVLAIASFGFFLIDAPKTRAQQNVPFPWISWRTQTYVPAGFIGKILPTANSSIEVSLEIIDGGKPANLRQNTIYWYANGEKIGGGVGVDKINLRASKAYGVLSLRAVVQDYPSGALSHTIQIPITRPLAVVDAPYARNEFFGSQALLKAIPYFFQVQNANSLAFNWTVNGSLPESRERPDELTVNINPDAKAGSGLNISLSITNPLNPQEQASAAKTLIFLK